MTVTRKKIKTNARRLVLDRAHMVAMLTDPGFYTACPHFLWLRDSAMQLNKQYLETPVSCSSCKGDFQIIRPVVDAFFDNLKQLRQEGIEDATEGIKRYLETKKGYRISEAVFYYRASRSQPHPAKFVL